MRGGCRRRRRGGRRWRKLSVFLPFSGISAKVVNQSGSGFWVGWAEKNFDP